jgi:hypothetical protein
MSPRRIARCISLRPRGGAFVEFFGLLPELHAEVSQGRTLHELIESLSEVINESVSEDDPPNAAHLLKARDQLQTTEFRSYLAGRLGLL